MPKGLKHYYGHPPKNSRGKPKTQAHNPSLGHPPRLLTSSGIVELKYSEWSSFQRRTEFCDRATRRTVLKARMPRRASW